MKRKLIGLLAVIIAFANISAAPPAGAAAKTYTLSYQVTADHFTSLGNSEADARKTSRCSAGRYSKLDSGAILKITNQNGKLLVIGKTVWKVIEVTDIGGGGIMVPGHIKAFAH